MSIACVKIKDLRIVPSMVSVNNIIWFFLVQTVFSVRYEPNFYVLFI